MSTLDRLKLADNRVVIATSDNGGVVMSRVPRGTEGIAAAGHQIVGSLRGRKHSLYEGGFGVPYIVRWSGHVPPGTFCKEVVSHADLLATCVAVLGDRLP